MGKKGLVSFLILFLFSTTSLSSQSLVELSKRENERRPKFRGKSCRIVTNINLSELKKGPVVKSQPLPLQPETTMRKTGDAEKVNSKLGRVQDAWNEIHADGSQEKRKFATGFLPSSEFVHYPEEVIGEPDGKFAEIEYWGWLDLEVEVKNEDGDDIAIHAKRSEGGVQDHNIMHYLVFVQKDDEWICIGVGSGITSPEKFDLGDVKSVGMIRIIYRNRNEINQPTINVTYKNRAFYRMGIDAVEALH